MFECAGVIVCECACVHAIVRACVCVCECVCERDRASVYACVHMHVHANVSVNVYWCDLQICPQTALVIDAHSHGRLNRYGKQSVVMRVEIDKLSLPKLASLITP